MVTITMKAQKIQFFFGFYDFTVTVCRFISKYQIEGVKFDKVKVTGRGPKNERITLLRKFLKLFEIVTLTETVRMLTVKKLRFCHSAYWLKLYLRGKINFFENYFC